jgi:hypothetical protein
MSTVDARLFGRGRRAYPDTHRYPRTDRRGIDPSGQLALWLDHEADRRRAASGNRPLAPMLSGYGPTQPMPPRSGSASADLNTPRQRR